MKIKILPITGDASSRIFSRIILKKENKIIVYAKNDKYKNLAAYTAVNKFLRNNKVLAPKLVAHNYEKGINYRDINNSIITVKPSVINNDKTVYGVYSSKEIVINESNVSTTVYYVNSVGEGGILVSNYNGDIQNGDYITTCPRIGYGALQTDDILPSYTVAKCTQTVDWSSISTTIEYNSTTYKYCYLSCTYHCG